MQSLDCARPNRDSAGFLSDAANRRRRLLLDRVGGAAQNQGKGDGGAFPPCNPPPGAGLVRCAVVERLSIGRLALPSGPDYAAEGPMASGFATSLHHIL